MVFFKSSLKGCALMLSLGRSSWLCEGTVNCVAGISWLSISNIEKLKKPNWSQNFLLKSLIRKKKIITVVIVVFGVCFLT